jgi:hypothetical protein
MHAITHCRLTCTPPFACDVTYCFSNVALGLKSDEKNTHKKKKKKKKTTSHAPVGASGIQSRAFAILLGVMTVVVLIFWYFEF